MSTLTHIQQQFKSADGSAYSGYTARIFKKPELTGALIRLTSDGNEIAGVLRTNSGGLIDFWIEDGTYAISLKHPDTGVLIDSRELIVGTGIEAPPLVPFDPDETVVPAPTVSVVSNGPISANRVVKFLTSGKVDYASAGVLADRFATGGISTTSTSSADQPLTMTTLGILNDDNWNWTPGQPIFLGLNGLLTQTLNLSWEFSRVVAYAITSKSINVSFREPIVLE